MAYPAMSDESACRAVRDQHRRFFPSGQYRFIKRTNPILALRSLPIFLHYAVVLRIRGQPEALPVRRAGVVETG